MEYTGSVTNVGSRYCITVQVDLLLEADIAFGEKVELELVDGKIVISKRKKTLLPDGRVKYL